MPAPKPTAHRGMAMLLVLIALVVAATLATTFVSGQATSARIAANLTDQTKAHAV